MKDIEKAQIILKGMADTESMPVEAQKHRLLGIMSSLQKIKRLEATENEKA